MAAATLSQAQIFTENFNDFLRRDQAGISAFYMHDSLYHKEVHNSDSIHYDLTDNNLDLSWVGYGSYAEVIDSTTAQGQKSPWYNGGGASWMNNQIAGGGSFYGRFQRPDAGSDLFELAAGEGFTLIHFGSLNSTGYSLGQLHGKFQNGSNDYWRLDVLTSAYRVTVRDDNAHSEIAETGQLADSSWAVIIATFDPSGSDSIFIYFNGDKSGSTNGDVSDFDDVIANTGVLYATWPGADTDKSILHAGWMFFNDVVLTEKQINEMTFLAYGWKSKQGKAYRPYSDYTFLDDQPFFQGFSDGDTIYTAIPDTSIETGYYLSLNLQAKGASGGETVYAYIGDSGGRNSDLGQISVTGSFSSYEMNLGTISVSEDSIYFYTGSGETVYIDSINLTTAADAGESKWHPFRKKKTNPWIKWNK